MPQPEAIRLVIWDLDDTYWTGTLVEEGMTYLPASQEIVIELARRGIMSSICSKNDHDRVRRVLEERGAWEYFVFASINWEPKGPRIREIVEAVQLRPASILFVDDSPANLQEAAFHTPLIQLADPSVLPNLLEDRRCRGKDDSKLSRLQQYKVLERKYRSRSAYSDNSEFLRASNIRVTFEYDVEAHLDRAIELINRTNQLNFTKDRLSEEPATARLQLTAMLRRHDVQAALVKVVDAYGDYGYAGIYVMDRGARGNARLRYYTFSCRILNMHIETWVYRELGRPTLRVRGEVLTDPIGDQTEIDWISLSNSPALAEAATEDKAPRWPAVYLRGGCDLAAMAHYCAAATDSVVAEYNFSRDGIPVRLDHSLMLWYALKPDQLPCVDVLLALGYERLDLASQFFETAPADGALRVLSFWADIDIPLYRHKGTGTLVPFALFGHQSSDMTTKTAEEMGTAIEQDRARAAWEFLVSECEHVGAIDRDKHLAILGDVIRALPTDDQIALIAANEAVPGRPPSRRHAELNDRIALLTAGFPQIRVLYPADFIAGPDDVHDLNHFGRMVYFRIFSAIRDGRTAPVR